MASVIPAHHVLLSSLIFLERWLNGLTSQQTADALIVLIRMVGHKYIRSITESFSEGTTLSCRTGFLQKGFRETPREPICRLHMFAVLERLLRLCLSHNYPGKKSFDV